MEYDAAVLLLVASIVLGGVDACPMSLEGETHDLFGGVLHIEYVRSDLQRVVGKRHFWLAVQVHVGCCAVGMPEYQYLGLGVCCDGNHQYRQQKKCKSILH